jgi:hypothetical protein
MKFEFRVYQPGVVRRRERHHRRPRPRAGGAQAGHERGAVHRARAFVAGAARGKKRQFSWDFHLAGMVEILPAKTIDLAELGARAADRAHLAQRRDRALLPLRLGGLKLNVSVHHRIDAKP